LVNGPDVLVDVVVRSPRDHGSDSIVGEDGEGVEEDINEDLVGSEGVGVQPGSVLGGTSVSNVEETEELGGSLLNGGGGKEGTNSHDETVGEVVVVGLGDGGGINLLEFHIHLEGELEWSSDDRGTEEEEANEVEGFGETEEVTNPGVSTIEDEGGTLSGRLGNGGVLVNGNTSGNDIIADGDGGNDTRDDSDNTTNSGVEDWDSFSEDGVTLGTEETPKGSYGIDGVVVELTGLPLEFQPGDGVVEIGPVEAGIEDAGLSGILGFFALAGRVLGSTISTASTVIEEGFISELLDEIIDISKRVAACSTESESACVGSGST